ncbi:ANTAR domain-containing protein [Streptomyces sp. MST-110588]|uniref:ANTAR domain-containing protein n=1 Tax=Streptomyces sp. MST-110588 TaxID=2833628 RepID=UPI001F5DAA87|nr:ANTAR domain-containing protein [Streptomyces sp. MST-110588]UNO43569.1 ANTAR domain-containing protein [Streptomyces sp. MST-110588]
MSVQELLNGLEQAVAAEEHRVWAVRCAHALGLEGIAVSLRWGAELVWFSDDISGRLEDAQFTLGQGPSISADFTVVPYQVADLQETGNGGGPWPQFAAEAGALQVRAMFVWPVRSGAARLGTLTGYRTTPGFLTARQAADGLRVADALTGRLLAWQPGTGQEDGRTREAGSVDLHRAEVHQATGVLSIRLGVPLEEALVRLRAQAFASGRTLADIAQDVLSELPP